MAREKTPEVPKTHNLDDAQLQDLTARHKEKYQTLLAKKKAADADLRNFGKIVKSDLGDYGLDSIKLWIKIDDATNEETDAEKAKVDNALRVMRWAGIPIGIQGELWTAFDERPLEVRAFELGRADGMAGKSMKPPIEMVGTQGPAYEEYCRGWHLGQDKIFDIRETGTKAAEDKAKGKGASIN